MHSPELLIRLIFRIQTFYWIRIPPPPGPEARFFDDQILFVRKKYFAGTWYLEKDNAMLACLDANPRTPLYSDPLIHLICTSLSLTGESGCIPDLGLSSAELSFRVFCRAILWRYVAWIFWTHFGNWTRYLLTICQFNISSLSCVAPVCIVMFFPLFTCYLFLVLIINNFSINFRFLTRLKHPNCIKYHGCYLKEQTVWVGYFL